jgi:NAD(P)-dependent dehydrogenase (short-subunit alcohol dehydrogenase family)
VSACATDRDAIQSLAKEVGTEHRALICDVTQCVEGEEFATPLLDRFGPPDLLLNNAAVINLNAKLWEDCLSEEFPRVIDVNLKGAHGMIRALLPTLIARGRGVVVSFLRSPHLVAQSGATPGEALRPPGTAIAAVLRVGYPPCKTSLRRSFQIISCRS